MKIYFTDYFEVSPEELDSYGAFNISLINDLPAFIDPFLLFNSNNSEYQDLHENIIKYVQFLRDESKVNNLEDGLIKTWYRFPEVKQNWLGYSKVGNKGSGLGEKFSRSLHKNLHYLFYNFGDERITKGSHLEKLCLIEDGIGRDNISDFVANLIKGYLCQYTQKFAEAHIKKAMIKSCPVSHVEFNYKTKSWATRNFNLPFLNGDYILLTPKDILTKDDEWINKSDMFKDFDNICSALPNDSLRAQVNNYFKSRLPEDPSKKELDTAKEETFRKFSELIDYYIKYKEDNGDEAISISEKRIKEIQNIFIDRVKELASTLSENSFYEQSGNTYTSALKRINFLKQVIENNDGYRFFYVKGTPIKRESDLQLIFRLTWFASSYDVNSEVNNGRGPVDYKISKGARDSTLVEFKLASNSKLKSNLKHQVEIYEKVNQTHKSIKVIMCFSLLEMQKVEKTLKDLGLENREDIILIDASRDNKDSASNVR